MNILFCSAGRRVELIKEYKKSISGKVVVTDVSRTAPAIYVADRYYDPGLITGDNYIDNLVRICKDEEIDAITTLIDPEISILSKNRDRFEEIGVSVLCPYYETAELCFDKAMLIDHVSKKGIRTVQTWVDYDSFSEALSDGVVRFPVFVKPRKGSGSVGAERIDNMESLKRVLSSDGMIIQRYMGEGVDLDADIYVDLISRKPVSIFTKRKLENKIGGASKTISFIDEKLNEFILRITDCLELCGPVDMDFFYLGGEYYLSEINPRFGGAYIHAYECGVDFFKLIQNNVRGKENSYKPGSYEENMVMMMYDSIVVEKIENLIPSDGGI